MKITTHLRKADAGGIKTWDVLIDQKPIGDRVPSDGVVMRYPEGYVASLAGIDLPPVAYRERDHAALVVAGVWAARRAIR